METMAMVAIIPDSELIGTADHAKPLAILFRSC